MSKRPKPSRDPDTFGLGPGLTAIIDDVIARAHAAVDLGLPISGCSMPTAVLAKIHALHPRRRVQTVREDVA